MIWLDEPFKTAWRHKDSFVEVMAIGERAVEQDVFRNKEGRRTLKFSLAGKSYFLKHHRGIGWREVFKNLLQLRLPVVGARNEYEAAKRLSALGVDTLKPVAFGQRGHNPAQQESFLITEDLVGTISLEDFCRDWPSQKPSFPVKKALIERVALTARIMHENGINHRDFYICHFLLDTKGLPEKNFHCYLIDLHRCQFHGKLPQRWREKDLAGLLYSTMDIGLTARDYFRFMRIYSGKSLRDLRKQAIWRCVWLKANKLYQKDFSRAAPEFFWRAPFSA